MAKYMVIRLKESLFKPLLEDVNGKGHGLSKSYSEAAGKAIFWAYLTLFKEYKQLKNKTIIEHSLGKIKKTSDEFYLEFLQLYINFLKTGKRM